MTLLPDSGSTPDPRSPSGPAGTPPARPSRALLVTLLLAAGAGTLLWSAERLAERLYALQRPRLERQIGALLGHPLRLGPFRGVGPQGLEVGPSELLPAKDDRSRVRAEALRLRLDPWASWQLGGAVLHLDLIQAAADLHRDPQGRWWQLGKPPKGRPQPLDLRLRLLGPARLNLHDNRPGLPLQRLSLSGALQLRPDRRRLALELRLRQAAGPGRAALQARGSWAPRQGWAQLQVDRWPLSSLLPLIGVAVQDALPPAAPANLRRSALALRGQVDGRLTLQLRRAGLRCQGDGRLQALSWQPGPASQALTLKQLPWACRERRLELADSSWAFGRWRGQVQGRFGIDRQLDLAVRTNPLGPGPAGRPLQARLRGRLQQRDLVATRFDLRQGDSWLQLQGQIGQQLELAGPWRLDAAGLAGRQWPRWLRNPSINGRLRLDGRPGAPRLQLQAGQPQQTLLGPWQAALRWQAGLLTLDRFETRDLRASGSLPLALGARGLRSGPLQARLVLDDLPLARLNPLLGSRLQGRLTADGSLSGPLATLRPDLDLRLQSPGAGTLQLQETWQGRLLGHQLTMAALAPAQSGRLQAQLNRRWLPDLVNLERGDGSLQLSGSPRRYRWQARGLPLQGLAVALGPRAIPRPLQGALSGSGQLELQPLGFQGDLRLDRPEILGVGAGELTARVLYGNRDYRISGTLRPFGGGVVNARLSGRWGGALQATLQARELSAVPFRQLRSGWSLWQGRPAAPRGLATDLGSLAIDTLGASLEDQLKALELARQHLQARNDATYSRARADLARQLQLRLDADLRLKGPDLRRLQADLLARGHIWLSRLDRDQTLAAAPLELRLQGPLQNGGGTFSLSGVSFALIHLLTPVPEPLRGSLTATGRYRLGGRRPQLEMDLQLADGRIGQQSLLLERGQLTLRGEALQVGLALRAEGAANSVEVAGRVPLDAQQDGLELRVSSRGDGLWFLANLAPQAFRWTSGRTDLQLLVRGSLSEPIANGFLRLREGNCQLLNQSLRQVEGTLLFDFEQLLVQELRASVGPRGQLRGEGRIGLVRPLGEAPSLKFKLEEVPLAVSRLKAIGAGQISLGGSLSAPELGGQLTISRGAFDASPAGLAPMGRDNGRKAGKPTNLNELLESKWDFREPLVLLGPSVQSDVAESLSQAVPRAPWVRFDRLRLRFGPDLRVVMGTIANFRTAGLLTVNGPLDPSLRLSGVMRLLGGRLNLFTTSFSLDPDTPNVAVFTPSLGLVPYLDIALRTRVADSLDVLLPNSNAIGEASITGTDPNAAFASFSQMKLVQVTVSVSGPADRLAENLRLRSSPPLPQERLVALIGGNSLAGLSGGAAGTALATAVGQTLLSPLLSSLSDVFGQRVSLAVYPSYVNQAVANQPGVNTQRIPPQLVLATEIGFDLTNRLKASVLAAPNRSDIPSQLTLNYKASDTFSFETSVDTQGALGGQLQVFFRF